jgi:hypothetical protein
MPESFRMFAVSRAAELPMEPSSGELELMEEEEIVSIASRYKQPISEAPSNVYVITDEDIKQSGAIDLPTVLRRIPGMEVMQTTGADFNVSVRGDNQLQANKLLVLVDGRSIYIDASGQVLWKLLPVTLPEIKRIEVLKGPASAVYGYNAFDGIVNIITKSPEEMKGATLQFGAGEFSQAMHKERQAAIAQFVQRGKEELVMVRPVGDDKLMLHILYYGGEVRQFEEAPAGKAANGRELELATQLIRHLQRKKWDPSRYHDTYRQRVLALIKKKQAGEKVVTPKAPRAQGKALDLMTALKQSLQSGQTRRASGSERRKKASKGSNRRRQVA